MLMYLAGVRRCTSSGDGTTDLASYNSVCNAFFWSARMFADSEMFKPESASKTTPVLVTIYMHFTWNRNRI